MLAALKEVMRENPTHCIGKEHDDYHMARGIVSHANSTTKLDDCDGYQFICNWRWSRLAISGAFRQPLQQVSPMGSMSTGPLRLYTHCYTNV